ncbi:hypothetical protein GCM10010381_69010 [Streptomyces xantholiticus]|nr:hypothetical protein GCM10010381_69010 [Streptomyces xantholiticus]
MELDRRGVELLFQVLTKREEKNPRPSPTPGSARPSSTASPSVATSFETGSDSYRLAHTRARAEQQQTAS